MMLRTGRAAENIGVVSNLRQRLGSRKLRNRTAVPTREPAADPAGGPQTFAPEGQRSGRSLTQPGDLFGLVRLSTFVLPSWSCGRSVVLSQRVRPPPDLWAPTPRSQTPRDSPRDSPRSSAKIGGDAMLPGLGRLERSGWVAGTRPAPTPRGSECSVAG